MQNFSWLPGLHLKCLGVDSLQAKLLLYSALPVFLIACAIATSFLRSRSVVPALPFVLRLTYIFYPAVASLGFQTLGACDCFVEVDGSKHCFLPADYSVRCPGTHAGVQRLTGGIAVAIYGIGVPTLYAVLLFQCRLAIRDERPTPLSTSLAFLHASLCPWALFWPLVEAARALLLTGFLALVSPGQLFQLLCGFAVYVHRLWVRCCSSMPNR